MLTVKGDDSGVALSDSCRTLVSRQVGRQEPVSKRSLEAVFGWRRARGPEFRDGGELADGAGEEGEWARLKMSQGVGRKSRTDPKHLLHPVPQAVHHQPQRPRRREINGVAGPGPVEIPAPIGGIELVEPRVVETSKAKGDALVIPLGRVGVNHIKDDLEAFSMKNFTMRLNSPRASRLAAYRGFGAK